MASSYTPLLGLVLPVTGELSGSWGSVWNDSGTSLIDAAISGTTSLTTDADVTLTTTTGVANQSRQAIILWNPASGTVTRNITAPAQSKIYTVINASGGTQSIVFRGAGPTTGVTIVKGESAVVAWNGTDFIKISNAGGSASFTNVTVSGTTTLSGLTASTALALDASKNVVSVTNTGTGNNVLATSPTLVTPALGTPSSATLTNATGLPVSTGISGLGTGVATALAVNVGTAGAPVINGGVLGTPSSGTVTNLTGTASININGTVGATTATTGAFTTLSASGDVTLSGGTANGVAFANGSKVLTTGSALTFDGTNFGVGTASPAAKLGVAGNVFISGASPYIAFDTTQSGSTPAFIQYASSSLIFGAGSSEQMRLTSTGLGIGTSSPAYKLDVDGGLARFTRSSKYLLVNPNYNAADTNVDFETNTGMAFTFTQGTSERMRLDSSGNLGIGTSSPGAKLDVNSTDATTLTLRRDGGTDANTAIRFQGASTSYYIGRNTAGGLGFSYNAADLTGEADMTLDSSGNLGLGVTPSAWRSVYRGFDVGTAALASTSGTSISLQTANAFLNDSSQFVYKITDAASSYRQLQGTHAWFTAPSGTAGNAISFSQVMTLDASGNLLLGATGTIDAAFRLQVTGAGGSISTATGTNSNGLRFDNTNTTSEWSFGTNSPGIQNAGDYFAWNRLPSGGSWSEFMRLDSSGNLGLGVTPSAWDAYKPYQVGWGALASTAATQNTLFSSNVYFDGSTFRYIGSSTASYLQQFEGAFIWKTAPSGTAGDAISFTQAMTLDASGNLLLGTTSGSSRLVVAGNIEQTSTANTVFTNNISVVSSSADLSINSSSANIKFSTGGSERARIDSSGNLIQTVNTTAATLATNGTLTFSIVDNSTLRISVRGSDGTTRTATVALT
jgi:hypothetical protein